MRQVLSKGMFTAAAVTGILSVPGAFAFADADADAVVKDSPGVASGNSVSVPIDVSANVCGNSLDILGALNPAFGNDCTNEHDVHKPGTSQEEGRKPETKPSEPAHEAPDQVQQAHPVPAADQLAETGNTPATIAAAGLGAVLVAGGAVLYRRGRATARR